MTEGYCVVCKKIREMRSTKATKNKDGRKVIKGKCTKCGTPMWQYR